MTRRFPVATLLAGLLCLLPAVATMAADDKTAIDATSDAELGRIEKYLNGIQSMKAGFVQLAPDGSISEGTLYMERPGKLRFAYKPPSKILMVARRGWVTFIDYEIRQVSRWPIKNTPFGALIDKQVIFGETAHIADIERRPDTLAITLDDPKDRRAGSIKLVFSRAPIQLRQWEVTDAQGLVTRVGLSNPMINIAMDRKLFRFRDPRAVARRRR